MKNENIAILADSIETRLDIIRHLTIAIANATNEFTKEVLMKAIISEVENAEEEILDIQRLAGE